MNRLQLKNFLQATHEYFKDALFLFLEVVAIAILIAALHIIFRQDLNTAEMMDDVTFVLAAKAFLGMKKCQKK